MISRNEAETPVFSPTSIDFSQEMPDTWGWVVTSGGSFGGSPLRAEIGLGQAQGISEVEIRWPIAGGTLERLGALALDGWYVVVEGEGAKRREVASMRLGASPPR